MQLNAEAEMANVIQACLPVLDEIGAAFIPNCWLREPKVPLTEFSEKWKLSPTALAELRNTVLMRIKHMLATRGIESMADVL